MDTLLCCSIFPKGECSVILVYIVSLQLAWRFGLILEYVHLLCYSNDLCRYGHVIAIVGMNPQKKYLVSPKERAELLREMLKEHPDTANVRVEGTICHTYIYHMHSNIIPWSHHYCLVVSGLIWRFAKQHGATVFFRGIRSWKKDGREERSLQILNTWGPLVLGPTWPLPTMYLEGNPEFNHISSTLIRNLCHGEGSPPNEALSKLVPSSVVDTVANLYSRKEK